jgi:hypothetical protein
MLDSIGSMSSQGTAPDYRLVFLRRMCSAYSHCECRERSACAPDRPRSSMFNRYLLVYPNSDAM